MKKFNITGVCIKEKHYMIDISEKIAKIMELINDGQYFTINRARQFGKTTTLFLLEKELLNEGYLPISFSFEGFDNANFENSYKFSKKFLQLLLRNIKKTEDTLLNLIKEKLNEIKDLDDLGEIITEICQKADKKIVLIIDEVDKSSNNDLFLSFLGMLRNKYLLQNVSKDVTFYSVILAGVYDIKNLKLKYRKDEEEKFNSPWNIAAEFDIDMSFNESEIATMLVDYEKYNLSGMNIIDVSTELYKFTSGYPFLVSKLCKIIDEKLDKNWTKESIEEAVKLLLLEKNTLFDDLIKNLENNEELCNLIVEILIEGKIINFNIDNPIINLGFIFWIFNKQNFYTAISNKIFEIRIYNYLISKRDTSNSEVLTYKYRTNFVENNRLNFELVLTKFQEIMHDEYREKEQKFKEREGRLLFLCFVKPILNGAGFYFVEPETRLDNRMDIIITYGNEQFIVELKIWHGENYEKEAIEQLARYLESKRLDTGYLISFCFNKNFEYVKKWQSFNNKQIFAITV